MFSLASVVLAQEIQEMLNKLGPLYIYRCIYCKSTSKESIWTYRTYYSPVMINTRFSETVTHLPKSILFDNVNIKSGIAKNVFTLTAVLVAFYKLTELFIFHISDSVWAFTQHGETSHYSVIVHGRACFCGQPNKVITCDGIVSQVPMHWNSSSGSQPSVEQEMAVLSSLPGPCSTARQIQVQLCSNNTGAWLGQSYQWCWP